MRNQSRRWTCATGAVVLVLGVVMPVAAQGVAGADARAFGSLFETPPLAQSSPIALAAHAVAPRGLVLPGNLPPVEPLPPRPVSPSPPRAGRGPLLPALYVGFGALQALDAHSTLRAVDAGHREANPVMAPFASQPAAMIGLKAVTAAGTIYMVDRLARRNRVAATVLMVALNGAYAAIVSANYGR